MPILEVGINLICHFTCNYNCSSEGFHSSKRLPCDERYSLCHGVAKSPSQKFTSSYQNQRQKGATIFSDAKIPVGIHCWLVGLPPPHGLTAYLTSRAAWSSLPLPKLCSLPALIRRMSLSLEN